MRRLVGDRGGATTETVIVMPLLLMFLLLVVLTGRLTDARSDIVGAANDAARMASLQGTQGAAVTQAQLAATDTVNGERIDCDGGPDVDTSFPGGFGRGGTVHVEVTCRVNTGDLTAIGMGTEVVLHGEAWEPIDEFRSFP